MRRALLIAVAAGLLFPAGASACTIAARPAEERVGEADRAAFAKVLRRRHVETDESTGSTMYRYRLRVLETYKGSARRRITIVSSDNDGMCGLGRLRRGARLGLVLEGRRGPWSVGIANLISRRELRSVRRPRRR